MTVQANFNGRTYVQPGSYSAVDATALNTIQLGYTGIVAVIGSCASGKPKTPLLATSPGQLKAMVGSGPAYDAARAMFTPSTQIVEGNAVRPQLVYVVRVDPATQATATLLDGASANTLTFTSKDYGFQTNRINVTVAASTLSQSLTAPSNDASKKVTITYGTATEVYDNLGVLPVLTVTYTGNASAATLTTTATQLTTALTSPSDGSANITAAYTSYPTIQQLADYINSRQGYTATIRTTQPVQYLSVNLDYVAAQGIKSATVVNLYGVVSDIVAKINASSSLVTVSRVSPGNLPPANISTKYLSGATTGSVANQDYIDSLNALSAIHVNFLTAATSVDAGLAAIFAAYGDTAQGKNELHIHLGATPDLSLADLATLAAAIGDVNVNLWFQQPTWFDDQGVTTVYDPWMMAAFAVGVQGGTPVGSSLVGKSFSIVGETHKANDSTLDIYNNADQIILDRLSLVRYEDSSKSFEVVRALTTYSQDQNDYNTEIGIRGAMNVAVYALRNNLKAKFKGARTQYSDAGSLADSMAREIIAFAKVLEDNTVITKGSIVQNGVKKVLPSVIVDSVTISGDIARCRIGLRAIGSLNFIFETISVLAQQQSA